MAGATHTKTPSLADPSPSPSASIVALFASPSASPSTSSSSVSSSPTPSSSSTSSSSSSSSLSLLSSYTTSSPSPSASSSSTQTSSSPSSIPSSLPSPSSSYSPSTIVSSESGDPPETEDAPVFVDYQNTMAVDHPENIDPKISIIISPEQFPVHPESPHGGPASGVGPLPEGPHLPPPAPYPPHEASQPPQQPGDRANVVSGPPVLYIGTATIHAEEIGLVLLVLLLWVGAITLFINRWGKLRMLEPYQPAYTAPPSPHRHSSAAQGPCINIQSTSELSLAENGAGGGTGSGVGSSSGYHAYSHPYHHHHHHHHSVSGPSDYLGPYGPTTGRGGSLAGGMLGVARSPSTLSVYHLNPQRKVKSAVDLVSLVMQEKMNTNLHLAATNV